MCPPWPQSLSVYSLVDWQVTYHAERGRQLTSVRTGHASMPACWSQAQGLHQNAEKNECERILEQVWVVGKLQDDGLLKWQGASDSFITKVTFRDNFHLSAPSRAHKHARRRARTFTWLLTWYLHQIRSSESLTSVTADAAGANCQFQALRSSHPAGLALLWRTCEAQQSSS